MVSEDNASLECHSMHLFISILNANNILPACLYTFLDVLFIMQQIRFTAYKNNVFVTIFYQIIE